MKAYLQERLGREGGREGSKPGFWNCVQELEAETQCGTWQKELRVWDHALASSHIKDQRDQGCAFQTDSGSRASYESILACHTLQGAADLHRTLSSAHQGDNASFSLHRVWTRAGDDFRRFKHNKMHHGEGLLLLPSLEPQEWQNKGTFWFWCLENNLTLLCPRQGLWDNCLTCSLLPFRLSL